MSELMRSPPLSDIIKLHGPLKLLFFGPPGVGKGTFANIVSRVWGLPHVSTGDMIRAEILQKTKLGKQFTEYSDSGNLVPDELVCDIAAARLAKPDMMKGYILDGFPRTINQAEYLESTTASSLCLNFTLPERFLIQKLAGRRVCRKCGKNFNVASIKDGGFVMGPLLPCADGSCDQCGSHDIVQRVDDREDVVTNRLNVYMKETAPLLDFYIKTGVMRTFCVKKGIADAQKVLDTICDSLDDVAVLRKTGVFKS